MLSTPVKSLNPKILSKYYVNKNMYSSYIDAKQEVTKIVLDLLQREGYSRSHCQVFYYYFVQSYLPHFVMVFKWSSTLKLSISQNAPNIGKFSGKKCSPTNPLIFVLNQGSYDIRRRHLVWRARGLWLVTKLGTS